MNGLGLEPIAPDPPVLLALPVVGVAPILDPTFLTQLLQAARGKPRAPVGDPCARRNKDFKV